MVLVVVSGLLAVTRESPWLLRQTEARRYSSHDSKSLLGLYSSTRTLRLGFDPLILSGVVVICGNCHSRSLREISPEGSHRSILESRTVTVQLWSRTRYDPVVVR